MKVYLAGSISGTLEGEARGWREYAEEKLLKLGLHGYSPMRGTAYVKSTKDLSDQEKVTFHGNDINSIVGINVRDFNDCKTADAILVNLLGAPKVSIGTVMEIAWARAFQIPVVIVMEKENVHNHGMLIYGNVLTDNLDNGIESIIQILLPKVYDLLVSLGGANPKDRPDFVRAFVHDNTTEWRFSGHLGFGGKYRKHNQVTCYNEDETLKRLDIIEQINFALYTLENRKIVYIDMDGVVADFDTEVKKVHPTIFEHHDGEYRGKIIDEICEKDPNIFSRLLPIEGAIEAVTKIQKDYEVYFLSTPMWGVPESFTDKRLWVEKYFGDLAKKRLILTHRKDLNIGDYLIDDRLKNGAAEFSGKHIHFRTTEFPDWKSVVDHLYYSSLNF